MLHVHRGERTDVLVDALADLLADPPDDPFAPEVVAVPARGVERWITQRLSHRLGAGPGGGDGVCARIDFPPPARLVAQVVAAAAGIAVDDDPWRPEALAWPLLEVIDESADPSWCPVLSAYLGVGDHGGTNGPGGPGGPDGDGGHRRSRRYAAAAKMARLFTSYSAQRPAMVRAWAAGDDSDGTGAPLPPDLVWQADLWRRVRARIAVPGPAEWLPEACARVRDDPSVVPLPSRVSVFGPTRLTADQLSVLHALAAGRDVHLWLPHPSPGLWAAVEQVLAGAVPTAAGAMWRRRADPTLDTPRHPLLQTLGRDARELHLLLTAVAAGPGAAPARTLHHPPRPDRSGPTPGPTPDTLLGMIQADVRDGVISDQARLLAPGDRSLQVHACYGPARQVEVLREILLGLLADDPTLEPRDVLVMCPDVEAFAPLVRATFGLGGAEAPPGGVASSGPAPHPGHRIRVSLADRSVRRTNPLLDVTATVLDLAGGRCTATQVIDLADMPAVRRRFGFDDADLERMRQWVAGSGVRWGLDAAQRSPFKVGVEQNTWRAGIDRILLGVAMRDEDGRHLDRAVPLDDVSGEGADLAGRLAEMVDRLSAALEHLTGERPVTAWLDTLSDATAALAAPDPREAWQADEAGRALASVARSAGATAAVLGLADVRSLMARLLEPRPTRSNFRVGDLTVCSLVPMRSVPHRVVVLLGMDDGALGHAGDDGDDVLARDPLVGERDRRSEQRQLVLDAVMAARETLVVLYTGADDRTNATLPPAVPVAEILDAADRTARTGEGRVREAIVVRHPLQPFDPRYFPPSGPSAAPPLPPSFDPVARAGAVAMSEPRLAPGPFLGERLPPRPPADVELVSLATFVEHPVKAFLRQRLGITLGTSDDAAHDEIPVELRGLQAYAVGEELLRSRLRGEPAAQARLMARLRGVVPPVELGERALRALDRDVDGIVAAAAGVVGGEAALRGQGRVVDTAVDLGDGTWLTGSVPDVRDTTVLRLEFSRMKAKHRLRAWVQVLALAAGDPARQWRAATVCRSSGGSDRAPGAATSVLTAPDAVRSRELLVDLVALMREGMTEALPLPVETSCAFATATRARPSPQRALAAARGRWTPSRDSAWGAEGTEPEHVRVWGDLSFEDLAGDGTGSRFAALATRLWLPLLEHEQVTS